MKLFIQASRKVERTSSPSLVSSKWRALTSLIIKELLKATAFLSDGHQPDVVFFPFLDGGFAQFFSTNRLYDSKDT